jgi:hypothetical protein
MEMAVLVSREMLVLVLVPQFFARQLACSPLFAV